LATTRPIYRLPRGAARPSLMTTTSSQPVRSSYRYSSVPPCGRSRSLPPRGVLEIEKERQALTEAAAAAASTPTPDAPDAAASAAAAEIEILHRLLMVREISSHERHTSCSITQPLASMRSSRTRRSSC